MSMDKIDMKWWFFGLVELGGAFFAYSDVLHQIKLMCLTRLL